MSLSPSEREALGQIEDRLRKSDPRLAAVLTYWTIKSMRWPPARMWMRRRGPGSGELARLVVVAAALALVIGLAVVGVLTTPSAGTPGYGRRPVGNLSRPAPTRRALTPRPAGTRMKPSGKTWTRAWAGVIQRSPR